MKKYFFSFTVILTLFIACKKENNTPAVAAMDRVDTSAAVVYSGNFVKGPYGTVSGKAKILSKEGRFTLVLENVTISNGPDLHVYLSRELLPVNFIDLGKLKSVGGTQVYEVPEAPNFTQYKYALVHCQLFNHLFGSAPLL